MRKNKIIEVPAKTQEALDFVKCDLCGKKGHDEQDWGGLYRTAVPNVSLRMGLVYPESHRGTTIEYHICPDCFKNKLMKWMEEQGAIATESEWDY